MAVLAVSSLLSCEKKMASPSTTSSNKTTPTDANSGKIFTVVGNGYTGGNGGGYTGDGGQATSAELYAPNGIALDAAGDIFIADCNNFRIRKVNTNGIISTYAGNGYANFSGDGGQATAAELYGPYGLAVDGSGNLYIADNFNNRIRKINAAGIISTFAGNGTAGGSGDGTAATAAEISLPYGVAFDGSGNFYIAEFSNVRKVNTAGIISTIAGNGYHGYTGDGGAATAAELYEPYGVTADASGNIYIADILENCIRLVNTNGIISTIAGNGFGAPSGGYYSGDGGPATAAELNEPTDVILDGTGNVYIYDGDNYRIRMVNTSGIISTIVGTGAYGFSGDGGIANASEIGYGIGITLDGSGNLYISDLYFNRVRIVYK